MFKKASKRVISGPKIQVTNVLELYPISVNKLKTISNSKKKVNYKKGKQQLFRDVAEVVNVRRKETMNSATYRANIIKAVMEQGEKVDDDYVIFRRKLN